MKTLAHFSNSTLSSAYLKRMSLQDTVKLIRSWLQFLSQNFQKDLQDGLFIVKSLISDLKRSFHFQFPVTKEVISTVDGLNQRVGFTCWRFQKVNHCSWAYPTLRSSMFGRCHRNLRFLCVSSRSCKRLLFKGTPIELNSRSYVAKTKTRAATFIERDLFVLQAKFWLANPWTAGRVFGLTLYLPAPLQQLRDQCSLSELLSIYSESCWLPDSCRWPRLLHTARLIYH